MPFDNPIRRAVALMCLWTTSCCLSSPTWRHISLPMPPRRAPGRPILQRAPLSPGLVRDIATRCSWVPRRPTSSTTSFTSPRGARVSRSCCTHDKNSPQRAPMLCSQAQLVAAHRRASNIPDENGAKDGAGAQSRAAGKNMHQRTGSHRSTTGPGGEARGGLP